MLGPSATVFFNYGDVFDGAVDLIWATPAGDGPLPIPADVLGEIITVLDRHGAIAMHAASYDAIDAAIGAFLPLAGGGSSVRPSKRHERRRLPSIPRTWNETLARCPFRSFVGIGRDADEMVDRIALHVRGAWEASRRRSTLTCWRNSPPASGRVASS